MAPPDVRKALEHVLGNNGDATVFDYCISMLEDEDFEWGDDAEEAFESLGPFLVRWSELGG
jgi:ATP-binding cassette subfamily F protein 3